MWRDEAPHVLAALLRRYGGFEACEDAVQEALLAAAQQWSVEGVPERPRGWLIRVASRRLIDAIRSDAARERREQSAVDLEPRDAAYAPAADDADPAGPPDASLTADGDDTLHLLMLCCHPALTAVSQVALTLRAVAGLTTAQIAACFLVPEPTMAQRISRAKATLRQAGARFDEVASQEQQQRLGAVRQVLHLMFTEGHTASGGRGLLDVSLSREAIRLTRALHGRHPDPETAGLLALMLLTHARAQARTDRRGDLVPLADQDRTRWDSAAIAEGIGLVEQALPRGDVGPFQLQAAIAAVHAEAPSADETDWPQIEVLYRMLDRVAPGPAVTLNLAVAVAMAQGPQAGLAVLEPLLEHPSMLRHHRTHAVRAHLLELAGRREEALEAFALAARLSTSEPEQRYLNRKVTALRGRPG